MIVGGGIVLEELASALHGRGVLRDARHRLLNLRHDIVELGWRCISVARDGNFANRCMRVPRTHNPLVEPECG